MQKYTADLLECQDKSLRDPHYKKYKPLYKPFYYEYSEVVKDRKVYIVCKNTILTMETDLDVLDDIDSHKERKNLRSILNRGRLDKFELEEFMLLDE